MKNIRVLLLILFLCMDAHSSCIGYLGFGSLRYMMQPLALRPEFIGEQNGVWISNEAGLYGRMKVNKIWVKTDYLDDQKLSESVATIDDQGRLKSNFDPYLSFIFVVMLNGELRVFPLTPNSSPASRVKHSSLAQGESVLMAGTIELKYDKTIYSLKNNSGHYAPSFESLKLFAQIVFNEDVRKKIKLIKNSVD